MVLFKLLTLFFLPFMLAFGMNSNVDGSALSNTGVVLDAT